MFIRKDLPLHAQLVQSSHAALEMGLQLDPNKKPTQVSFLILLEVRDQDHLHQISEYLELNEIDYHMFFEPDYDMGHTAICTEPMYGNQRNKFKKFELWKQIQ